MSGRTGLLEGALAATAIWIPRLAALSATWWLQVLAGGVLLGFAPASSVLAASVRRGLSASPLRFRQAWSLWRTEFIPSQLPIGVPAAHLLLLGAYAFIAEGAFWHTMIAAVSAVFALWLLHVPVLRDIEGGVDSTVTAPALWLGAIRHLVRRPGPAGVGALALGALTVVLVIWLPVGLVVFIPASAALAASLGFAVPLRRR